MSSSFDTKNRRLTRRAIAGGTEWGDAPPGLACDPHARTTRKPHKRLSGLRMNRTISELKIALLRSSLAFWSIEF
jgi:hypothetical protein